jgi:UDP-hydrolysing UDP-N-acetyl-D-glucosamine 2-epimerase
MKHIAVLTGKRGGYDAMLPLLRRLEDAKWCNLTVIACDQHLYGKFGETVLSIEEESFKTIRLRMQQTTDKPFERTGAMSSLLYNLAEFLLAHPQDFLILFGDRLESLTAAFVAHAFNIPIVHIQGGDKTGGQDEQTRHAITTLSNHHLVSNGKALSRVSQITGDAGADTIKIVGDLHVDPIVAGDIATKKEVSAFLGHFPSRLILGLFHPDTNVPSLAGIQISNILRGVDRVVKKEGIGTVIWVYPCTDIGHEAIIQALDDWNQVVGHQLFPNIPHRIFLALLTQAQCLVGNSSAGIIEAAYTKTWAVDIGNRQEGRLRDVNVIPCEPSERDVEWKVSCACTTETPVICNQVYGDGTATQKVFEFLEVL